MEQEPEYENYDHGWLLVTRGLYWRPNAAGYTCIKAEAGQYSLDEMKTIVKSSNGLTHGVYHTRAPEFTEDCCDSDKIRYLTELRDIQDKEIARLNNVIEQYKLLLDGYRSVRSIELYKDLETLQDVQLVHDTHPWIRS